MKLSTRVYIGGDAVRRHPTDLNTGGEEHTNRIQKVVAACPDTHHVAVCECCPDWHLRWPRREGMEAIVSFADQHLLTRHSGMVLAGEAELDVDQWPVRERVRVIA